MVFLVPVVKDSIKLGLDFVEHVHQEAFGMESDVAKSRNVIMALWLVLLISMNVCQLVNFVVLMPNGMELLAAVLKDSILLEKVV